MKLLLIVALLSCALAQCPPFQDDTPEEPLTCQGADMVCGGTTMTDDYGCQWKTHQWCMTVYPEEKCPSFCPPECQPTELICPGEPNEDGCPTLGTCMPSMIGDCPAHCPVQCGEMEMFCPGEKDPNDCAQPDFCIPIIDPLNRGGTFCPVNCKENEIFCPGAPGAPDTCLSFDPEGSCATVCPTPCKPETEMSCPGGVDANGCAKPDFCIAIIDPLNRGGTFCPVTCKENEIVCRGAPGAPDTCLSFNPEDSCFPVCPAVCNPQYEMSCPGDVDDNDCAQPDFCIPLIDPLNPGETFCPVNCKENEIFCPGAPGAPDTCLSFDPEDSCLPVCPPACNPKNEIYCQGNINPETGCENEGSCQRFDPSALCQNDCPIQCPPKESSCFMGYDENGCTKPEQCSVGGVCPEIEAK